MPDRPPALEARRSPIVLEIAQLGDFRCGSILPTSAAGDEKTLREIQDTASPKSGTCCE